MRTAELNIHTGSYQLTDLTGEVQRWLADEMVDDGLLHVFCPHATAGLALMELGSGSEADVEALLARLLPREEQYQHRHGSSGHGADHLLPVLCSPSLTLPVVAGHAAFGTWQRLVLVDTNADNPDRQVRLSFLAG
ncbi:MAG: secondary thiamine-phosphate synthase enzyme YjbQ [Acidimicrobiales bacterium]